jgi:hypothetical protein
MSDEGRVTPADMMLDIMLHEVTPDVGKGALGTWLVLAGPGH